MIDRIEIPFDPNEKTFRAGTILDMMYSRTEWHEDLGMYFDIYENVPEKAIIVLWSYDGNEPVITVAYADGTPYNEEDLNFIKNEFYQDLKDKEKAIELAQIDIEEDERDGLIVEV